MSTRALGRKGRIFNGLSLPHLFAGLAASIVAPAGRAKDILPLFLPADILPGKVLLDGLPFVEDQIGRTGFLRRLGQPVLCGLILFGAQLRLERAEQLIPDDQEHPHVLIEVTRIGGMVYPVVRRGDEDIFQPAHLADELGMDKDAPDVGGLIHEDNVYRLEPYQGQGNEIKKTIQRLEHRAPETDRKIHQLGGVVGDMNGPEQPDLMIPTVEPVVKEILGQQQEQPVREDIADGDPVMTVAKLEDDQVEAAEEQVDAAVEQHQVNIGNGILPGISLAMAIVGKEDFQTDDN